MLYLKQSTASQSDLLGPFVDDTDGATPETGLTIANTDIRLSANGGNMFAKTSGGGTHDENGWYTVTFDATDTATVGRLRVNCKVAGALAVWTDYQVLEEAIFDALFGASAAAFDSNQRVDVGSWLGTAVTLGSGAPDVNIQSTDDIDLSATQKTSVNTECDTALTDYDGPTRTEATSDKDEIITDLDDVKGTGFAKDTDSLTDIRTDVTGLNGDAMRGTDGANTTVPDAAGVVPTAIENRTEMDSNSTQLSAILLDTGTTLDGKVDGIKAVTDLLPDSGALTTIGTDTARLTAARAQVLTDWINAGRLDLILDAIKAVTDLLPDAGALSDLSLILTDTNELQTDDVPGLIAALNNISSANVLTQVNAAIDTAISELSQAKPTATPSLRTGLMLLYMALRNKLDITATTKEVHADDGTQIATKALTDDTTTYSEAEMEAGT